MGDEAYPFSQVSRVRPSAYTDQTRVPARFGRYGDQYVIPLDLRHLSDEGSLFEFRNNTNDASTTLAGHPAPVLADADATMTKPLVFMRFTDTSGKRLYLHYIEIEVVTAGASGTQACWADQLDTGATRYSSGTVETAEIVNPNMQSSELGASYVQILMGPVVVGAESSSVRRLGFGTLRPSIEIAGDKKVFVYGNSAGSGAPIVVAAAAAAAIREQVVNRPAVVLGPTDQYLLALHGQASQSAAGIYKVRGLFSVR